MKIRYFVVMLTIVANLFATGQAYSQITIHKPTPTVATTYETTSLLGAQSVSGANQIVSNTILTTKGSQSNAELPPSSTSNAKKWWNLAKKIYLKGAMTLSILGKFLYAIIYYVDTLKF